MLTWFRRPEYSKDTLLIHYNYADLQLAKYAK